MWSANALRGTGGFYVNYCRKSSVPPMRYFRPVAEPSRVRIFQAMPGKNAGEQYAAFERVAARPLAPLVPAAVSACGDRRQDGDRNVRTMRAAPRNAPPLP